MRRDQRRFVRGSGVVLHFQAGGGQVISGIIGQLRQAGLRGAKLLHRVGKVLLFVSHDA